MRLFAKLTVPVLSLGMLAMPALAQDEPGNAPPPGDAPRQRPPRGDGAPPGGPGGPGGERGMQRQGPLSPEKAKAAWEWEVKGVAKSLGLTPEQTTKVIAAYTEARTSNNDAMEKMRNDMREKAQAAAQGDGGAPEDRAAMAAEMQKTVNEARKADADKLSAALAKDLSADQVTKAMKSLGSFNPSWDNMVNSIAEFKLGDEKTYQALTPIEAYVIAVDKVRDSTDPEARRTAMTEARDSLTDSMKKILDEEQMGKFQRSIMGGGRMGGGMGGPGGGAGRGGARGGEGGGGSGGGGGTQ